VCRPSPPPDAAATSVVVEKELNSRDSTIVAWEDGQHALGRACMEHDVERAQIETVR
jgi:hypothetical protein